MIFAAAPATATPVTTFSPTGPAPCSSAMIAQRSALDEQVKFDTAKVDAAMAGTQVQAYASVFMRLATNMRALARINGALDACAGVTAVGPRFRAMFASYTTQRRVTYQALIAAELKLNELWHTRDYKAWLRQLRAVASLHRTLAKIDTIIAIANQPAAQPPQQPQLPNNGSGFTTVPQDDHHEVDDGHTAMPDAPTTPAPNPYEPPPAPPSSMSPSSGGGSGGGSMEPVPTEPPTLFTPIWNRRWFWPAIGLTAVVTGMGLMLRQAHH